MTNAIASKTSQIKRGDGGDPEVFSAVAEVKSISPSGGGQEFIDVTHLNSSGSYREQLSSFKGNPTISIEVN